MPIPAAIPIALTAGSIGAKIIGSELDRRRQNKQEKAAKERQEEIEREQRRQALTRSLGGIMSTGRQPTTEIPGNRQPGFFTPETIGGVMQAGASFMNLSNAGSDMPLIFQQPSQAELTEFTGIPTGIE